MSLSDAMQDVKSAVANGAALNAALLSEIATDYELNPKLLERKINEAGWTEDSIRAFVSTVNPAIVFAIKLAEVIERAKQKIAPSEHHKIKQFVYKGETYTYIGSYTANRHICVSHADAVRYILNTSALRNSTFTA